MLESQAVVAICSCCLGSHVGTASASPLRPRHGGHPVVLRAEDDQIAVAQQLGAAVHRQNPRRAEGEPSAVGHATRGSPHATRAPAYEQMMNQLMNQHSPAYGAC